MTKRATTEPKPKPKRKRKRHFRGARRPKTITRDVIWERTVAAKSLAGVMSYWSW